MCLQNTRAPLARLFKVFHISGQRLKNHTARFAVATTYSISAIKYLTKQSKEGRVCFGSEFGNTPHHGGKNKVMLEV